MQRRILGTYIVSRNEEINSIFPGNTLSVSINGKPMFVSDKVIDTRKVSLTIEGKGIFVYGNTSTEEREKIRATVENVKKFYYTIASYGTFSTGVNIRNINNIVLASPSKSKIRVLQSIGRGLRKSETKDSVLIFDIIDDMTFRNQPNLYT